MKYEVWFSMNMRYTVEVEANTEDEALNLAHAKWEEAEFGEAEFIDGEAYYIEREDKPFGRYLD